MLDNRYDEHDGVLADRGWEEMRRLLDREMPVAEKPRRRWLFWLLLCIGLAGAVGAVQWDADELPGPEPQKTPQPVAGSSPAAASAPAEASGPTALQANPPVDTPPRSPALTAYSGGERALATPVATLPSRHPGTLVKVKAPPVFSHRNPEKYDALNAVTENEVVAAAALLPAGEPELLSYKTEQTLEWPAPPQRVVAKKRWRLAVEGAGLATMPNEVLGYSGGLRGAYRRGRWGMATGLFWQHVGGTMAFLDESNVAVPINAVDQNDLPESFLANNPQALQGRYVAELQETNYLVLPALLTYRPARHWQLEGGVQLAYLVKHRQDARYEVDLEYQTVEFVADPTRGTLDLSDLSFEEQAVNRFDLRLQGGLSFLLSERVHFHLHYIHGFVDPLEINEGPAFNRQVRLGMSYSLLRSR